MKKYIVLWVGGFFWDAILTLDVVFVADRQWFLTGLTTFVITVLSFTMYDKVINKDGMDYRGMCALAFGSSIGAMIGTLFM